MKQLLSLMLQEVVVFDGAMGTWLCEQGISHTHPFEELNLSQPDLVMRAHQLYISAGAQVIETNTFGANHLKLARHGLEDRVYEINLKAAELARTAAGDRAFVAGSIGPIGALLAPLGPVRSEDVEEKLPGQLKGLIDGGVDLILIETQPYIDQAELLVRIAVEKAGVPVMCSFSFGSDVTTADGVSPEEAASRVEKLGVSAIGANCALGPDATVEVVARLRSATALPIVAQPNAGLPAAVDGRTFFVSSPRYFAEKALEIVRAGANAVGGCCGTRPDHIAAVSAVVAGRRPEQPSGRVERVAVAEPERPKPSPEAGSLLRAMKGDFLTLEVNPPKDVDFERVVAKIRSLKNIGLSAVNVTDNPMARVRMSSVAFAHLLKDRLDLPAILHFTCRDRNLLGLQSELLGAAGLGIDGVLALTGDPASVGDYPQATSVFDVTSEGLVKIISNLNQGLDYAGKSIGMPTGLTIGVAFNPLSDDPEKELGKLRGKKEMGAHFVMTQPVYDTEAMEDIVRLVKDELGLPVIAGLLPLTSSRQTEYLHNEVPGVKIPEKMREAMAQGDANEQKETGIAIAAELYSAVRTRFNGVCLMLPGQDYEVARRIVNLALSGENTC